MIDALGRMAQRDADVTVSALVREAGISRGTFYTHYSGLEELAGELQTTIVHDIAGWERERAHHDPDEAFLSRRESIAQAMRMVVAHYAEYRTFYAAVFALPTSLQSTHPLVEALADELHRHIVGDAQTPDGVNAQMASLFMAGGWATLISEWVLGRIEASEDDVTRHLVDLLPEWMYRLR
ncbi:TetR/AcrR family transcriptional regulator (plasmid) [Citricoccus sp. SGAir0253]|nr:TetR/AcrR family transcriptional regulator [Citricoccus sp. SGAir0253]